MGPTEKTLGMDMVSLESLGKHDNYIGDFFDNMVKMFKFQTANNQPHKTTIPDDIFKFSSGEKAMIKAGNLDELPAFEIEDSPSQTTEVKKTSKIAMFLIISGLAILSIALVAAIALAIILIPIGI